MPPAPRFLGDHPRFGTVGQRPIIPVAKDSTKRTILDLPRELIAMNGRSTRSRRPWIGRMAGLGASMFALAGFWFWYTGEATPGDATDPDQVAFGARVYGRICANCHGSGLDGQLGWQEPLKDGTRLAPAHNANGKVWRLSDQALFQVVKLGGRYLKPDGGASRMPAFENKLTDQEIWSVIAFIKSNWPADLQEAQREATAR